MRMIWRILLVAVLLVLIGCNEDGDISNDTAPVTDGLFRYLDSTVSGIDFINKVEDQEHFNVLSYRNFYNGGGVGIGDFDNDGLDDIFFSANMTSNQLYLNKGGLKFDNISVAAGIEGYGGWSTGVSLVDINADGFLDIYVANSGDLDGVNQRNELFINNGNLTFTERAKEYNLDHNGYTTHAAFFDYDNDGDLDCYILNNSFKDPSKIDLYSRTREENDEMGGDRLMRNDGNTFTDVSAEAGIFTSAIGFGLGVAVGDINNDLWPDIYISNDFWERDYLYVNNQDGTFSEELTDRMSICSVSSMGADMADINNDGYTDIFSTDMLAADNYRLKAATIFDPYHLEDLKYRNSYHYQILQNCLQLNRNGTSFREVGSLSGVSATDWSWGALIFDFDNDINKDIYVCNGIYHDIMFRDFADFLDDKEEIKKIVTEKGRYDFRDFLQFLPSVPVDNYAFVNDGKLNFEDQAAALGFKKGEFSNGSAYGDLDNDGDYDLVLNNINAVASIYVNKSDQNDNHYLSMTLVGDGLNPDAVGAKIVADVNGTPLVQEIFLNRGFQSSVSKRVIMGIGEAVSVSSLKVIWPDKSEQIIPNPTVDAHMMIKKSTNRTVASASSSKRKIVTEVNLIDGDGSHHEDIFNDFDIEPLLPRMHSTEGPRITVADVNGDGLEDFLTLGARDDSDKLFIQTKEGRFKRMSSPSFEADKSFESTAATFLDADGDGDQDLLIGAGGNELAKGIAAFSLRYYENDGKGNLIRLDHKCPKAAGQVSVITAGDFDKDGDQDIFIGGRSIPGNYGLAPRSFLMRNDGGGQWTDITTRELGTAGMITDALWTDIDRDDDLDLLIVGEWMPVTMFINEGGKIETTKTVPQSNGWWLAIEEMDLDGDGVDEYVLGNWGHNSKFRASAEQPLEMYLKDFDGNGKTEFIINWYPPLDDSAYPFASKDDLTKQLPHLKKRILKYDAYATKNYTELLTKEERSNTKEFLCHTLSTSILTTTGSTPQLIPLSKDAQIAPTFGIASYDYDNDGQQDLWLGGNFYGLKPEAGHLNASRGVFLKNKGNLKFEETADNPDITQGEVRDAAIITLSNNKKALLIARNNLPLQTLMF